MVCVVGPGRALRHADKNSLELSSNGFPWWAIRLRRTRLKRLKSRKRPTEIENSGVKYRRSFLRLMARASPAILRASPFLSFPRVSAASKWCHISASDNRSLASWLLSSAKKATSASRRCVLAVGRSSSDSARALWSVNAEREMQRASGLNVVSLVLRLKRVSSRRSHGWPSTA